MRDAQLQSIEKVWGLPHPVNEKGLRIQFKKDLKMQMTISGHHLTVTDPIRNYVTTKLLKLERRYELITKIAVRLTVDKLVQKAEATVHASGAEIFANSEHEDLYAAIDALSEKLNKQVIKHKQKQRGR